MFGNCVDVPPAHAYGNGYDSQGRRHFKKVTVVDTSSIESFDYARNYRSEQLSRKGIAFVLGTSVPRQAPLCVKACDRPGVSFSRNTLALGGRFMRLFESS